MGERVFFNFNCIVLDVAEVIIGSRTMFGPNVQIYTATHPLNHLERSSGIEFAKPITIGDDVWIGGSVVTKDIPADVIAAGNPCRIIRSNK